MSSNREAWLLEAISRFQEGLFQPKNLAVLPVKVSVGFAPGKLYKKLPGKCIPATDTRDGVAQIYINPTIDHPIRALEILCDMLCVASHIDSEVYKREIGLGLDSNGQWIAMEWLKEELELLAEELGPFPHSGVTLKHSASRAGGLNIAQCPACKVKVYFSNATKEKIQAPYCPCISVMEKMVIIKEAGR